MKKTIALAAIAALALLTGCGKKETLHVYIWADYISPEIVHKFEVIHGCKVQQDIFDSNEMMFAKLQAGGAGYDIVCPSHYYVKKMAATGMLRELDWEKMPALENLDPDILRKFGPEILKWSVPYFMSYTGLGYSKDVEGIDEDNLSWDIFLRVDLKDRMTLLDDYSEVIGAAARKLGYSFAEILGEPEKMDKVVEVARGWRKNIIKFDNEQYKNGLATGEFLVVMGYFSDLSQIVAESDNLALGLPKEGCMMSCDMLAIPSTAKNPELAMKFIDFVNQAENAAKNIEDVYAYCPNLAALEFLDEEVKSDPSVFVDGADSCILIPEFTPEEEQILLKAWQKIRSAE